MSRGRQVTRPTLAGVATAAGVSPSTASLVFSGKGPVAQATRQRVLAAAAELGYTGPDPLAASLRRGRCDVVGVIVEGSFQFAFRDPFALSVADGLASVLDQIPTGMLMMSQNSADPDALLERVRGTALDAVVLLGCGLRENAVVPHLQARGVPVVTLGPPTGRDVVSIDIDNRAAVREIVDHLRGLGHRRMAVLSLPLGPGRHPLPPPGFAPVADLVPSAGYSDPYERLRAVVDCLGDDTPTAVATGTDIDDGAAAVGPLLDLPAPQRPTAVIALSDLLAMGAIAAATDRGLRVPGDLSVTGIDGIEFAWWPGRLTTVVQPGLLKGRLAGEAVREALGGGHPVSQVVPAELRVGTTTGPPPAQPAAAAAPSGRAVASR